MKKFIYSIFLILTALIASNVVHAASTDYDGKWNGLISCTAYSSNATLGAFTRNNVYTIENGKVTSKYTTAGGKNVLTTTGVVSGVNTNLTISGTSETAQWFFNFKGKPSSAENISYIGEMVEQGVKKRDCTMEFSALDPAIGSLAFKKINSNQIASSSQPIKTPTSEAAKSPVTPTVPPLTKNAAPVQPVQPATNPAPKVAEKATNPQSASVGIASFDCNKATSMQEKLICTTPALSSLDLKLAEAYKSAQATTADAPKLKNEQIAWIKETRACGGDATCLERFYNTRINELTPQPAPIATPSTAPNVAAQASAPVASEPALAASEQAAPAPATPITTSPQASTVEEKTVPIWEDKYVKLGGGVVFALALLGMAYWLIKKLVLGLKKGATAAAKKGIEIRQDVAEKSALAKEKMVEKTNTIKESIKSNIGDVAEKSKYKADELALISKNQVSKFKDEFNKEGGYKDNLKDISAIAISKTQAIKNDIVIDAGHNKNRDEVMSEDNHDEMTLNEFLNSEELKLRIGKNAEYYIGKWKIHQDKFGELKLSDPEIKKIGTLRTWNWSASFLAIFWGLWRGVSISWRFFIFFAISMVAGVVRPGSLPDIIGTYATLPVGIIYGLYGNSWYLDSLIKNRNNPVDQTKPSLRKLAVPFAVFILVALIDLWSGGGNGVSNNNNNDINSSSKNKDGLELVCSGRQANSNLKTIYVDCSNRNDFVQKLENSWLLLRKNNIGGNTEDACYNAYRDAKNLHPSISFKDISDSFLIRCNMGLKYVKY